MSAALLEEFLRSQQETIQRPDDSRSMGSEVDGKSISELKQYVTKYTEIDSNIRRLRRNLQSLNASKKELEEKIIRFMKENEFDKLNTKDSLIECKQRVVKKRPPKKYIMSEIEKLGVDEELRTRIEGLMFNKGEHVTVEEKSCLKRTIF